MLRLLLTILLSSSVAKADCSALASWLEVSRQPDAETPQLRSQNDLVEWNLRQAAAQTVYSQFVSGEMTSKCLERCLQGSPRKGDFFISLQRAFLDGTIAKLKNSRQPVLNKFADLADSERDSLIFRLTGHFGESSPVEKKAGFHRISQSIFMDMTAIPMNEWPIIFIHEVLHSMDDDLYTAVKIYAEEKRVEAFKKNDLGSYKLSEEWLEAGLGRGLWSEYRAWYFTSVMYREGLLDGLWTRIEWMDRISGTGTTSQSLRRHVYAQLDRGFRDPSEGIFNKPEVKKRLKVLRDRYRSERLPPLGHLQKILELK